MVQCWEQPFLRCLLDGDACFFKQHHVTWSQFFAFLGFHSTVHHHLAVFDPNVCFPARADEAQQFEQGIEGDEFAVV